MRFLIFKKQPYLSQSTFVDLWNILKITLLPYFKTNAYPEFTLLHAVTNPNVRLYCFKTITL